MIEVKHYSIWAGTPAGCTPHQPVIIRT